MSAWDGLELGRAVVLFAAVAYVVIGIQVWLYHWAGGFRRRAMWAPVLLTPLVVLAALLGAVDRGAPWGWIALAVLAVGVADGLTGLRRAAAGWATTRPRPSSTLPFRTHDHPNLYVCDAGVLVTPGGAQPSQTIMALATRLADHLTRGRASGDRAATAYARAA